VSTGSASVLWGRGFSEESHKAVFSGADAQGLDSIINGCTAGPEQVQSLYLLKVDDFVKSRNQTAKKKDPDARRANPEK
jgi:hypothetical protein